MAGEKSFHLSMCNTIYNYYLPVCQVRVVYVTIDFYITQYLKKMTGVQ